ncbi:hypothetical protein [Arthrobacter woluwensis]|uniref:hypothetical protein n=1 Tax=Arthrobacter woluwensis TaxID=156980 RepID=UPI001AAE843B|nr:hypothetical protein [Arthrobacter woluwensis]QTF71247.1 hypothetical protein G8758_03925 [Arthrobacter woluwensis]
MPQSEITVEYLVQEINLTGISFYSLHSERSLSPAVGDGEDIAIEPDYDLRVQPRNDGRGFRVLLDTIINAPVGTISCGVAADYHHPEIALDDSWRPALAEFVNGVSLMHILPFTRQGIADLTQRTFDSPLIMPIIRRGELEFSVTPTP